jgi:coenzyme F420-reducing hydrogenase beta subunit
VPVSSFVFCSSTETIYENSASGGAFYALAKKALELNYSVYGASFDKDYSIVHVSVDSLADLPRLQGSKYVQSDTSGALEEVERKLKEGSKVLYSGTPCQIAGLFSFLGCTYENLLTIDIVCHGVPSPGFWRRHIEERIISSEGNYPNSIQFRCKSKYDQYGYILVTSFTDFRKSVRASEDLFYSLFMNNLSLRESCYRCRYASQTRISDITLGDCASIEAYPNVSRKSPVSIVLLNTQVGLSLFNLLADGNYMEALDYELETQKNAQLSRPATRPDGRDNLYETLMSSSYDNLEDIYLPIKRPLRRVFDCMKWSVPWRIRLKLKKLIGRL